MGVIERLRVRVMNRVRIIITNIVITITIRPMETINKDTTIILVTII